MDRPSAQKVAMEKRTVVNLKKKELKLSSNATRKTQ